MKIRSAVPENGCLVFCGERKKKQKKTETSVKHIRIRLIGGCVNQGALGMGTMGQDRLTESSRFFTDV